MHDINLGKTIDVQDYFNKHGDYYFTNFETGETYHVTGVVRTEYGYYREAKRMNGNEEGDMVCLDSKNNEFDLANIAQQNLSLNTIYDLDQFFGGAWCKQMKDEELVNSDYNTNTVFDIIVNDNLKEKFIGYAVNKSAFKVGATNVNSVDS